MAEAGITPEQASTLVAQAFALVRACPAGRVTTYGAIAKALGYPRGARMVGWIMEEATPDVPAQRVVNSSGELTGSWAFHGRMRLMLEAEGIAFSADGKIDMKRFGWEPLRDLGEDQCHDLLAKVKPLDGEVSPRLMNRLEHDPASPFRQA
jgi:methylated-DNA-protein-cysteine methyltransferase-like protein